MLDADGDILTATENGYGKRTPASEYPRKGRGTQGVILMRLGDGESLQAVECVDALVESEEGEIADPTAAIEPTAQP